VGGGGGGGGVVGGGGGGGGCVGGVGGGGGGGDRHLRTIPYRIQEREKARPPMKCVVRRGGRGPKRGEKRGQEDSHPLEGKKRLLS